MTITIKNDTGAVLGDTHVYTDDGIDITDKLSIESLKIDFPAVGDYVRAKISIGMLRVEIKSNDVEWLVKNPVTQQFESISSINFTDGTRLVFDKSDVRVYKNHGMVSWASMADGRIMKWKGAPDSVVESVSK